MSKYSNKNNWVNQNKYKQGRRNQTWTQSICEVIESVLNAILTVIWNTNVVVKNISFC